MKKKFRLVIILALLNGALYAQPDKIEKKTKNHIALGININNFGQDFGLGLNITSPRFFSGHAAIRVSENYQWLNHLDKNGNHTWTGYHMLRIGTVGINAALNNAIRLYGEGGVSVLLANNTISTESTVIGGYGLFGFEFLMEGNIAYFIELGGIGTGAVADKVSTMPIYANGFLASTGMRITL